MLDLTVRLRRWICSCWTVDIEMSECVRCTECNEILSAEDVVGHVRVRHVGPNDWWQCGDCQFGNGSFAQLAAHCFRSDHCTDKIFSPTQDHLNSLLREIRSSMSNSSASADKANETASGTRYKCPVCSELLRATSLQDHLSSHLMYMPWACSQCCSKSRPRWFSSRKQFERHCQTDHAKSDPPAVRYLFICLATI